jgi:hypothetical protein
MGDTVPKYYNLSVVLTRWLGLTLLAYAALDISAIVAFFAGLRSAPSEFIKAVEYLILQSMLVGPLRVIVGLLFIVAARPIGRWLSSGLDPEA